MAESADIPPSEGSEGAAGDYGPFAYLSTPTAPLYRRVMRALMAEKERFTVHVRPEQVWAALQADGGQPVEQGTVAEALDRLAQPGWGNLLAFPDSSRVTALEDFYRRRMLYQMSREGETAERALAQCGPSAASANLRPRLAHALFSLRTRTMPPILTCPLKSVVEYRVGSTAARPTGVRFSRHRFGW